VEAERRFASGLIAEARGAAPPAGTTIDEARAKVSALEAKTSHFAAAVDVLRTELETAKSALNDTHDKIVAGVWGVLKADPHVRELYADYAEATARLATLKNIVSGMPKGGGKRPDGSLESIPWRASIWPDDIRISTDPDYSLARAWFGYEERLRTNADAVFEAPTTEAARPSPTA
jgi:hypothetical protein